MTTKKELINRGCLNVFRRCSIKRYQLDGTYESSWYDITYYVKEYPQIEYSFGDDILLGDYEINGATISLDNSNRKFNRENNSESLFSGFASRRMTKFKIECGFLDDDNEEVEGVVFYGILYNEPVINDQGVINISLSGLLKVFQLFPAEGISDSTGTTKELVIRLLNKQQNNQPLLLKYIEGYEIGVGVSDAMTITAPEILDKSTVWDKIKDYTIYEDFIAYIDNRGYFIWNDRDESNDIEWRFNGAGASGKNDFAINIISIEQEIDGVRNFFPRVSIEYDDNTFSTSVTDWTPGDLSVIDLYGDRIYSKKLTELSQTEATEVAERLRLQYKNIKREWLMQTVFIALNLKDKVEINYTGESKVENPFLLGISELNGADLLDGKSGSIDLVGIEAKVISVIFDFNNITCYYKLREI